MSTHLVTGRAGRPHVSAEDIGAKDSGVFGAENYVLETGNQFACVIINNNLIRIKDGDLIMQGRHVRVEGYEEVVIENGQLAVKRQDLIVMRYEMDANTGLETAYFAVIKGTSGNEPEEPEYERGSISEGDIIVDFPLYKILLEGTNITSIETLFSVLMPMAKYQEQVMAMEKVIEDQQKELTELNGKITDTDIALSINNSYLTATFRRVGPTVQYSINVLKNLPLSTSITLYTLPEEYRPILTFYTQFGNPGSVPNIRLGINEEGRITAYLYNNNGYGNAMASGSYVRKNLY